MRLFTRAIAYCLLLSGIAIVLTPFAYMVLTSLFLEIYELPRPEKLLSAAKSLDNYGIVWNLNHFQQYFLNSFFIATMTMLLSISLTAITAYAFARFLFPGKELIYKIFIFSMFVPGILNIIPQFLVIKGLGLVDTYSGLILLYVGSGVVGGAFFLRGFFERIPQELEESIVIDGGGRWTIFRAIYLPLSLPALGTLAIFSFSGTWDEFVVALTLIKTEAHRTLPIALQLFRGQYATHYGKFFAASIIAIIPILVIFFVFQRQFVQPNLSEGGVKA